MGLNLGCPVNLPDGFSIGNSEGDGHRESVSGTFLQGTLQRLGHDFLPIFETDIFLGFLVFVPDVLELFKQK